MRMKWAKGRDSWKAVSRVLNSSILLTTHLLSAYNMTGKGTE